MSRFEPAPDYLIGEFEGRKRYIRVYDQDIAAANKYGEKVTHNLKARHTWGSSPKKCIGWQQPSESVEIVHADFTGLDVRAHVEKLLVEMDADIVKGEERFNKAIEKRKREEEAELQRRLRELE